MYSRLQVSNTTSHVLIGSFQRSRFLWRVGVHAWHTTPTWKACHIGRHRATRCSVSVHARNNVRVLSLTLTIRCQSRDDAMRKTTEAWRYGCRIIRKNVDNLTPVQICMYNTSQNTGQNRFYHGNQFPTNTRHMSLEIKALEIRHDIFTCEESLQTTNIRFKAVVSCSHSTTSVSCCDFSLSDSLSQRNTTKFVFFLRRAVTSSCTVSLNCTAVGLPQWLSVFYYGILKITILFRCIQII